METLRRDLSFGFRTLRKNPGFTAVACANVANLLLSRAAVRQKEIAIRSAVGASRLRIMTQPLTESILLGVAGGVVGLAIAVAAVKALRVMGPENVPRLSELGVDPQMLAFTCVVALLTGVVFGLAPALRSSRVDLNEALNEGGRAADASGHGHQRIRKLLVVSEIALSLVLLIGAGLLIRSYQRISNANPGFNSHNVLSMRLSLPTARYPTQDSIVSFYRRVNETLKSLPEVEAVGTTYSLPMSTLALAWEPIKIEGYAPKNEQDSIISNVRIVSSEYFQAMGIPLVKGRFFDERDTKGQPETVVVDEALAERFWPGDDPIGKRLQRGSAGGWRTVVGMIRDSKEYSAENEPPIAVYFPSEQKKQKELFTNTRHWV